MINDSIDEGEISWVVADVLKKWEKVRVFTAYKDLFLECKQNVFKKDSRFKTFLFTLNSLLESLTQSIWQRGFSGCKE